MPLVTSAYDDQFIGITLSFEVAGISLYAWIEEIGITNHYGVQHWRCGELRLKLIIEIFIKR